MSSWSARARTGRIREAAMLRPWWEGSVQIMERTGGVVVSVRFGGVCWDRGWDIE